jgi:glycosyltransferase involved in cell wall biosynthesis
VQAGAATLREYAVIYFGNDWFAENRTSSHHVARRLATVVPVLYIETPGSRAPRASARDFRKLWRKLRVALDPPRKIHDQLYLATIPQIPFRNLPLMGSINLWAGQFLVRRALRRLGFKRYLSWFVVPHPGALAKRLGENLTVYYCIDDYASHPGMDPVAIQALDDRLTACADVVFVAPRALVDAKRALNPNTHFSPHGVDFDLFSSAGDPSTRPAGETLALRHPVIGYFGTVGEFLDYELLVYLARARPHWTFLFIGYAAANVGGLRECGNVVLAGPQPYEELPRWAKAFDVAIYPHKLDRQVKNANSLKLREYLATGKPVVAVRTPETLAFADFVYLADNRGEEYLQAIERALREDSPELRRKRMSSVEALTWDARFRETMQVIDQHLTSMARGSDRG